MRDWLHIAHRAWDNAWDCMGFGKTGVVMIAVLTFFFCVWLYRQFEEPASTRRRLKEAAIGAFGVIIIFTIIFLAELCFIAPAQIYHEQSSRIRELSGTTNSLFSYVTNLATRNYNLQNAVDKDEAALKAVAAIAGITNGTLTEKMLEIPAKIDEMQRQLNNSAAQIAANTFWEDISISDTNRCWFVQLDTNTTMVLLKMRRVPLDYSIQGSVSSQTLLMKQMQLIALNHAQNIIYTYFSGGARLNDADFSIQYVKDAANTNLIQSVSVSGTDVYLDGKKAIFHPAVEKP